MFFVYYYPVRKAQLAVLLPFLSSLISVQYHGYTLYYNFTVTSTEGLTATCVAALGLSNTYGPNKLQNYMAWGK